MPPETHRGDFIVFNGSMKKVSRVGKRSFLVTTSDGMVLDWVKGDRWQVVTGYGK